LPLETGNRYWVMLALTDVEAYLRDHVFSIANDLDASSTALQAAFSDLGQRHWLGLKIPSQWGGQEIRGQLFQEFQELLARYSGALAFLQAQHQSAGSFLSRSENEGLKREYLPHMGTGAIAVGVGFSHLRQAVPPLKALPAADGFCLNGAIPWITGFGIFQAFVGAAVLPDGRAVYGMLPCCETIQPAGGHIQFSLPMSLAVMSSTNTVAATLQEWHLPADRVLFIAPPEAIQQSDRQNVLQHSFYALGCARAALDLLQHIGQARSYLFLQDTHQILNQQLGQCRSAIYAASDRPFAERLHLRATAIQLAVQCAHAAVIASGGSANSRNHAAQRIFREAMMFSVTGQTIAVMAASLNALTKEYSHRTIAY